MLVHWATTVGQFGRPVCDNIWSYGRWLFWALPHFYSSYVISSQFWWMGLLTLCNSWNIFLLYFLIKKSLSLIFMGNSAVIAGLQLHLSSLAYASKIKTKYGLFSKPELTAHCVSCNVEWCSAQLLVVCLSPKPPLVWGLLVCHSALCLWEHFVVW